MMPGVKRSADRSFRKRRLLRLTGTILCLLAMLTAVGGHWLALQSIAWGRMLVNFSRHDSVLLALSKTFDGQHPCSMCLQIRAGQQDEREEPRQRPLERTEPAPEFLPGSEPVVVLGWSPALQLDTPLVSTVRSQFRFAPPKPPPRAT